MEIEGETAKLNVGSANQVLTVNDAGNNIRGR